MVDEREFVQVENLNGEIEEAELIFTFKLDDSDKVYAMLTTDKVIGEEVNVVIGTLYVEDNERVFELVEDTEELKRIHAYLDKIGESE